MRRWLALLLIAMLPIQFVWAAAAPYCQHETSADAARHVGHHEHQHDEASDAPQHQKAADKAVKLVGDNDCGYCQFSAAKSMQGASVAVAAALSMGVDTVVAPLRLNHDPDPLERPNWRLA